MNDEARVRSLALFFFFAALDERFAQAAAIKALRKCQQRIKRASLPDEKWPSVIVHVTNTFFNKLRQSKRRPAAISYEAGWLIPEGVDLGPWMEFQKEADLEEFLAVLWSRVLGISDEGISEGLGVTVGTVRHRLGRGLHILGAVRRGDRRR
ncbi:MAG: hypothetical protein H6624_17830 [Bdellovibrionaceae bacterium]|nr:hypothetical protein [Bdellovibrionales bacterium]MCB9086205.1 hypothetical protein [Pseudobdellovibrionaceae bacterium]